ncbi:hypothetical protein D1007_11985 [Hordeum vulgare]|nr:hypothetical protein D1007_11985 [Hordeum vulgare]
MPADSADLIDEPSNSGYLIKLTVFYTIWKLKLSMLAAWAERFRALDGVNEVMPDPQRLLEYNLMRRARLGLPLTPPPQHQ